MDILTHFLVGYDLSKALSPPLKYSNEALIIGAILPDIDHIPIFIKKNQYFKYHRTLTHSLPMAPLLSIMFAFFIKYWDRDGSFWLYAALILIGILSHIGLDIVVPYGIKLFYPLKKWYYRDWVCVIDGVILVLLLIPFLGQHLFRQYIFYLSLFLVICFILFRGYIHYRITDYLKKRYAGPRSLGVMPTPLNPFKWWVIIDRQSEYECFYFNFFNKRRVNVKYFPKNLDSPLIGLSSLAGYFLSWARFPFMQMVSQSDKRVAYLGDLRFYNPYHRTLTICLLVDRYGKLEEEKIIL